jgi:hypothetical protein
MHRTFTITVPPSVTENLCQQLEQVPEVLGLSVSPGASRKPAGDVLTLHILNRGADEVLRLARAAVPEHELSISTAELASIIDPAHHEQVVADQDEAIWEEIETGLRHQSRITPNYFSLMLLGGVLAAVGLVSEPVPQAIAFISASIISPGFEPLAKIPLGLVLRKWRLAARGLRAVLGGYAAFVLSAYLTTRLLLATGATTVVELVTNPAVVGLRFPDLKELLVAGTGAVAGIIIISAYRRNVIAGPLIALALIPAAALIGAALAVGRLTLAWDGLERMGADAGFVLVAGLVVFGLKQALQHRRPPIV